MAFLVAFLLGCCLLFAANVLGYVLAQLILMMLAGYRASSAGVQTGTPGVPHHPLTGSGLTLDATK